VTPDKFADVERMPARVADPTPVGALMPTVSGGALMLAGESTDGVEFPFGANVASLLIFDLDGDHTVAQVETLMPLDSWDETDEDLGPPDRTRRGSVQIVGDAVELQMLDAEPRFLVNGDQGRALIALDDYGPGTEWIRLSDRCHALVDDGHLAGFAVDMRS
jgi:hypothetical protein